MTKEEKYSIAKWAMEHAVKNGAQQARVSIYNNNSSQIEVRDEKIDKLQESNRAGMRINLFVDKKYSSISTSRITNKEELGKFIEDAIAGTRYLARLHRQVGASVPEPDRTLMALAAYNMGPGRVVKIRRAHPDLPSRELIERHAYRETARYCRQILRDREGQTTLPVSQR